MLFYIYILYIFFIYIYISFLYIYIYVIYGSIITYIHPPMNEIGAQHAALSHAKHE